MSKNVGFIIAAAVAAIGWAAYADHPTARNLRKAAIASLQALAAS
jgi:hypothetical protein